MKKPSKSRQEKTRRLIIRTAVDLISERGYRATSMKKIAKEAGIDAAAIYAYFPGKKKLLLGYCDATLETALTQTLQTPGFDEYSLQERLQRLVDALLEQLLADREFVAILCKVTAKSPLSMSLRKVPALQLLKDQVTAFIALAEQNGEIPACAYKERLSSLFATYLSAVVVYWLKDESEEFSNTTQLVDLTLEALVKTLQSGLLNTLSSLSGFLVRTQFSQFSSMAQSSAGLAALFALAKRNMGR